MSKILIARNFFIRIGIYAIGKNIVLRCAPRDLQNGIIFRVYSTVLRYDLPAQIGAFARAMTSR